MREVAYIRRIDEEKKEERHGKEIREKPGNRNTEHERKLDKTQKETR